MAETTGISWVDSTHNPWIGCSKISPGCDHCYAEVSTPSRINKIAWGPKAPRMRTSESNRNLPLRWNAQHEKFSAQHGRRQRVFCASLADVFDNEVDPTWRDELWALIRATPKLDWLILTKRIGNAASMLPLDWGNGYPNVWLGITVVNQEEVNRDVRKLVATPAALRWLSMEPLLESVSFEGLFADERFVCDGTNLLEEIDWVVVGGESGHHARPMPAGAAESMRLQCEAVGVPFFFKQWGGSGASKGGALMDGVEVKAWPARF